MFVSRMIFDELEELAQNFNRNYSNIVDFLFYVFDRFDYDEKKNILKKCPLIKDNVMERRGKEDEDENKSVLDLNSISEEIKISIHPFLEERLINLILECDKLQTVSDALEFLLFVFYLIDKDLILVLIIRYSFEANQSSEFSYLDGTTPENYESPSPFHYIPTIPDRTQICN